MRPVLLTLLALMLTHGVVPGQTPRPRYETREAPERGYATEREVGGKNIKYYRLPFLVTRDGVPVSDVPAEEIAVFEDGERIQNVEILPPQVTPPTIVLALDISGSMARPARSGKSKMKEAQDAAQFFFDKLRADADVGLVLFDHQVRLKLPPVGDKSKLRTHRAAVRRQIAEAKPQGGTAYLDATMAALDMVEKITGPKVVIVMTDGVDMSSKVRMETVIKRARAAKVPIYTVGVGDPGKNDPVNTILVLDRSGSMSSPVQAGEKYTKMQTLHEAACHFVDLIRANSTAALLPFSDIAEVPGTLTGMRSGLGAADKEQLKAQIRRLSPGGGTCLYDATYEAIETLAAANRPGRRVVVVLTDGVDEAPGSRQRIENVIERANEAKVQIYTLGFGQDEEVNTEILRRMAEEPKIKGRFNMANNRQQLVDLFEALSIDIHDDGIDETALKTLARSTDGMYYEVRDASKLDVTYTQVVEDLKLTYYAVFPSRRQVDDGTFPRIRIAVEQGGVIVSNSAEFRIGRRGLVVVPEVNHWVFVSFLSVLFGALGVPLLLRRGNRSADTP